MPLRLSRSAVVPVLLSGFGLGLSFPPYPFPFLAWVALVPLLCRWARSPTAAPLLLEAYLAFLLTFAVAFYWPLGHALPSAALASLTPLLALPLVMALPFGASILVRNHLGPRAGLTALVACWMLVEGGLSRGPLAFPWTLLGHTQATWLPLIQMTDVTGVPGLTLWVWLMNLTVVALLQAPARRRPVLVLMLLLALPLAYGHFRRTTLPAPAGYLTVAVVQPALPAEAWADVHDTSRIDTLLTLTERLLTSSTSKPDLIVWPETALPVMPAHDPPRSLREAVTRWAVPLLTGAIVRMPDATYRNSAVLLRPDGSTARYDKQRLVPFAERVPFSDALPWLRPLAVPAGGVAAYEPGPPATPLDLAGTRLGVLICFESAFGNHPRPYLEQGAGLLVTLTQDGWWGPTPGYRQHLALTRLRAVETRRAVVQVSVSGMTALLLPDGSSAFEVGWMARDARLARVPLHTTTTVYARRGDVLTGLALLVALALAARTLYAASRSTS